MGMLGKWDEVEKKPRKITFTRNDELWEYLKLSMIVVIGYLFFHFIIMGFHL